MSGRGVCCKVAGGICFFFFFNEGMNWIACLRTVVSNMP